jgi:hypothetical protein
MKAIITIAKMHQVYLSPSEKSYFFTDAFSFLYPFSHRPGNCMVDGRNSCHKNGFPNRKSIHHFFTARNNHICLFKEADDYYNRWKSGGGGDMHLLLFHRLWFLFTSAYFQNNFEIHGEF